MYFILQLAEVPMEEFAVYSLFTVFLTNGKDKGNSPAVRMCDTKGRKK